MPTGAHNLQTNDKIDNPCCTTASSAIFGLYVCVLRRRTCAFASLLYLLFLIDHICTPARTHSISELKSRVLKVEINILT